jgi:hypothetical protein
MSNNNTNKVPATLNLAVNVASDDYVELTLDVSGGYVFRDRLKSNGFKFIRDKEAPVDPKTGKPKPAFWRRILVAVPPDVSAERAAKGISNATAEFGLMLSGMLEGSRVRGAKTAAAALAERWDDAELSTVVARLAELDTPWDNSVQRPAFAA